MGNLRFRTTVWAWCLSLASGAQFTNVSIPTGIQVYNAVDALYGGGISFYDFNEDGWDDVTACVKGDSVQFFLNLGGTFTRLEVIPNTMDAKHPLWVDYDNDGDSDFFFTRDFGSCKLYRNEGGLVFTDVTANLNLPLTNARSYGSSWADYDRDGWLDLYVCNYNWQDGVTNWLFRNNGDGTFENTTALAGVSDADLPTFQSVWFDYDFDGWIDLYVVNDKHMGNGLYRNLGDGTFQDVSDATGADVMIDAMCASVSDYDRDGDWDIYITNEVDGNVLLNYNNGVFTDVAEQAGVATANVGWGGLWIDEDRDLYDDLHVATAALIDGNQNYFFQNNQDGSFVSGLNALGLLADDYMSHSSAEGDYNNDQEPDFIVGNLAPHNTALYRNDSGSGGSIKLTLHGTASNRDAVGATIIYHTGGNAYRALMLCGDNYLSQNSQHQVLSISDNVAVDSLEVFWPSGWKDTLYGITKGSEVTVYEGETFVPEISASGLLCSGESITLDGGEHSSWLWSGGQTTRYIGVSAGGVYTVTVTNAFGIEAEASIAVAELPLPVVTSAVTQPLCHNDITGSIVLTTGGGVTGQFLWSDGQQLSARHDLSAGLYAWSFTDQTGCAVSGEVEIENPASLHVIINQVEPVACFGEASGAAVVTASGGTGVLALAWPDGVNPAALSAGAYPVTVTDANSCIALEEIVITEPPAIGYDINVHPACEGATGAVELAVFGGTGALNVNWGGIDPSALFPGAYLVEISDANACELMVEFTIVNAPEITAETTVINANDGNNGSALVVPSGGTPPYDYAWSTGSVFATVTGLGQGTYFCLITDSNGCQAEVEITIIDVGIAPEAAGTFGAAPNPFSSVLNVTAACAGQHGFALYDLSGRHVCNYTGTGQVMQFDTSVLAPGVYVLVSEGNRLVVVKE